MDGDPPDSQRRGVTRRALFPATGVAIILAAAGAGMPPVFSPWPVVIVAASLLALSGTLSAFEAALFSLGYEQLETLERRGRHGVISARALLAFRDETLTSLLVMDHVLHLTFVICVMMAFSHVVPGRPVVWVGSSVLVSAIAILMVGEYIPRAFGRRFSVPITLALARPIVGLTFLVAPLRWIILALSNALLGLPSESLLEREIGSEEELKTLITASDLKGGLEEDERELIDGVVEFGATRVGEIMTPRPEVMAEPDNKPHEDILEQMRAGSRNRILIYRGDFDEVRGVLHAKDLLLNPETDYREMLRKPLVVPESKSLMDLLREFRRERVHLAVVSDEFGRTVGVVTMHDLLAEIVGELTDEDQPAPEAVRPAGPGAWMVPGQADLDDLREQLGFDLPGETNRTISGFVTSRLERIPAVGDALDVEGFRLTVARMGVRRVALLEVKKHEPADAGISEEESS